MIIKKKTTEGSLNWSSSDTWEGGVVPNSNGDTVNVVIPSTSKSELVVDDDVSVTNIHLTTNSGAQNLTINKDKSMTIGSGSGFWVNAAVPEPAEWAMIFGAIALSFVAYRRRR